MSTGESSSCLGAVCDLWGRCLPCFSGSSAFFGIRLSRDVPLSELYTRLAVAGRKRLYRAKLPSSGRISPSLTAKRVHQSWQMEDCGSSTSGYSLSPPFPKITMVRLTPLTVPWKQFELWGGGGRTQGTKEASCFPPVIWAGEERGGFITNVGCNDREERGSACWVIVP